MLPPVTLTTCRSYSAPSSGNDHHADHHPDHLPRRRAGVRDEALCGEQIVKTIFAIACTLLSTACGPAIEPQTWSTPGCAVADAREIAAAGQAWNAAIERAGLGENTISFGESSQEVKCLYSEDGHVAREMLTKGFCGWAIGADIYILRSVEHPKTNRMMRAIALHELGHALGLGHAEAPGPAMWNIMSDLSPVEPTDADIEALRQLSDK
jgi:hypothetical protein